MIPGVKNRDLILPLDAELPVARAAIRPDARRGARHVAGEVAGSLLTYADLSAYAWWYGGGWLTLNRGKKGLRRVHRGTEDVSRVRR